jgi:hypothetical protein
MVQGTVAVTTAQCYELLLYVRGGALWPICDSNRRRHSCSCFNAPSLSSVIGCGEVQTVVSGVIGLFMVGS